MITVTRTGTNSALELDRRGPSHPIGTPVSASNRRAARLPPTNGDYSMSPVLFTRASLKNRPPSATSLPSTVVTNSVGDEHALRPRVNVNLDTNFFGAVIALGATSKQAVTGTGDATATTSTLLVGVRNMHGQNRTGRNRGVGGGVCYRGHRPFASCPNGCWLSRLRRRSVTPSKWLVGIP